VRIAVVYDNKSLSPDLSPAWGFSCLIGEDLLFDTGGDSHVLLSNMGKMGIDVERIRSVVLSHAHGDHTGGLGGLLAVNRNLTVYLPRSFASGFKAEVEARARVVQVHEPMEITEGIYTTGEMGRSVLEQSLVLVTRRGLVVITGCAHPGIVSIVEKAREIASGEVYLAMGGFHLGGVSEAAMGGIVEDFERLGVQKVGPCHCSGDLACSAFERAYGENFISVGVGRRLEIEG